MKYQLDTNFTLLNEKSGVIENQSTYAIVEYITCPAGSTPAANTGIRIAAGGKYRFYTTDSFDAYVRFITVRAGDYQREIAVVDDKICLGNSAVVAGTMIDDWQSTKEYIIGDFVIYNDNLYRSNTNHISGSFSTDLANGEWQLIGNANIKIDDWQSTKEYIIGDFVIYNDNLYQALKSHASNVNFGDDMVVGHEMWKLIGGGGTGSGYAQITKLGVTATAANPKIVDIVINSTTTFCKPPVEVLKFKPGTQDVVTMACAFDNADADDFTADGVSGDNAKYVEFDGVMKLRTQYEVNMSAPVALGSGFMSESDEIDFAEYKKVEAVG